MTVADAALMLTVLAEADPRDGLALRPDGTDYADGLEDGVEGLKIAFSPTLGGQRVQPQVAELVAAAARRFEDLGAHVEEADPAIPDCGPIFACHWFAAAASLLRDLHETQKARMDPGLLRVAERGAEYSLLDFLAAARERMVVAAAMSLFHQEHDLLLTPSLPLTAFDAGRDYPPNGPGDDENAGEGKGEGKQWVDWTPFTYPFNLTGQPAASVPCGLAPDGLPVGLQIVGPRYADALVLRAARAYERVAPFALPPL